MKQLSTKVIWTRMLTVALTIRKTCCIESYNNGHQEYKILNNSNEKSDINLKNLL